MGSALLCWYVRIDRIYLFASFYFAHLFSRESIAEGPRKGLFAVLYLFAFVVSQSLIAFDLVMSIEYPWYSTLIGAYTFIESIYSGIAVAGILSVILLKKNPSSESIRKVLPDLATMTFGFSLLWAGFFYSQFLVIWYGNLPEEISFLVKRAMHLPLRIMGYSVIFLLFVFPFVIFLSREIKKNRVVEFFALGLLFVNLNKNKELFLR